DAGALEAQISQQVITALKLHDAERTQTLRLIKNALKNKAIEKRAPLTPAEEQQALATMIKQRRDSIVQFEKGGRADLVDKEQFEISVLERYMPQALSDAEIDAAIAAAIAETGAKAQSDMGKVMGPLKARLAGRADMAKVSGRVKSKLTG
ncbi:MAG: GatB/YqeY domain-containing protein, partial [Burkholderiales bacterium]